MAYRINGVVRINDSGDVNAGIVTATLLDGPVSAAAITGQTEGSESDVTGADEILIYDQTSGDLLRVTVDEFVVGSGIGTLVTEFETLSVTGVSTLNGAVSLGSSLTVPDGESIFLGDSGDLQITHSGANSFLIDNGAGNLIYRSGTQIFQNLAGSKTSAQFATANSVDLYFDGNLKFQTVSAGATVAGTLFATDIETSENLFVTGLSTFRLPVVMNRSDSFGVLDAALDVRQSVDVAGRLDLSGINGRLGLATVNNGGLQDIRYVGVDSSLVSSLSPSNEVIPTEKAVKEYVDGKTNNSSSLPVGTVVAYTANSDPTDYFECDGSTLDTTTFSELFGVIGYTFGGSGSNFQLPDLRGEFIRGLDNGRGIDSGRVLGTNQAEEVGPHTHNIYRSGTDVFSQIGAQFATNRTNAVLSTLQNSGAETRPRNVALVYCIKYQ